MAYEIDKEQLRQWWRIYNPDNKLMEIRILGKGTYSAYFKDFDTFLIKIEPLLNDANSTYYGNAQAYFVLNEITPELYGREQHDRFVKNPKATTSDNDIIRRRFVFIDLDPERPAGISSSDEELEKAHLKCVAIYKFLAQIGFPEPIVAISGNGYRMTYACDMQTDEETDTIVKSFLEALSRGFSDKDVEIDKKVYNRSRIDKIIGTWAKKGSDGQERKWRMARFVKIPSKIKATSIELFKKAIDALPKEEAKPQPQTASRKNGMFHEPFDLEHWLQDHGLEYRINTENGIVKYQLRQCPWEDTHSSHREWDSAICKMPDGKIVFTCFHAHCAGKKWEDVRKLYEPGYVPYFERTFRQNTGLPYMPFSYRQKPKYEIKQEIPELGSKWMPLSAIKKINLSELERVETGVKELDRDIMGLFMSEVTILSGSNASGKSSFINTLCLKVVNQNCKAALWSGELRADVLKSWIQMAACRRFQLIGPDRWGRYSVPDNIGVMIDEWLDGKFYLYNNEYGTKWEQVYHDMLELQKHDVKFFVLDNLTSLDIDFEGDKNDKQKKVIEDLKSFAKSNLVHIMLVAHPRKSMGRGMNSFIRKDDIAGSSDLMNLADDIFIIHRNNNDFKRAVKEYFGKNTEIGSDTDPHGNYIESVKNRMFGVCDRMYGLFYEPETRRFKNSLDEDFIYGWDKDAVPQEEIQRNDGALPFIQADGDAPF